MTKRPPKDPLERYYTPDWVTRLLLQEVSFKPILKDTTKAWEPACGRGAITTAIQSPYPQIQWHTNDVDPEARPARPEWHTRRDIRSFLEESGKGKDFDLAITNPPFSLASTFLRVMLDKATHVAMLVRLSWLEGKGRDPFKNDILRHRPPAVFSLPVRVSFVSAGSKESRMPVDNVGYVWLVWSPLLDNTYRALGSVSLEERKASHLRAIKSVKVLSDSKGLE